MAEPVTKRMSIEEFLDWQTGQEMNWELVDGVPVMPQKSVTGATQRHDRVTVNIIGELGNQLRRGPCRPSTDDIALVTGKRSVRRPDVTVQCAPADPKSMLSVEPRVLVEVLSPSTMNYDRVQKLDEYKAIAAVSVILLVDTETPRITVWRRGGDIGWTKVEFAGLSETIPLPEVGATLALADVFEGVHDA